MPNDDDQLVGDGDDRLLVGSGTAEATELADLATVVLAQVAIGAHGGPRALDQDRLQVLVACAAGTVMAFAGRFVVARAQPHPRGQMLSRGEPGRRVGADFRDDRRRGTHPDPRDRCNQLASGTKGMHQLLDLLVESTDHRIELIQMSQVQPTHQGMVIIEAPFQRPLQIGDLRAHKVQPTHQGMVIIEAPFQRPLQIGDLRAHKVRLIVLRPSGPSPGTHTATAMMSWPTSTKAHRSYRICIPPAPFRLSVATNNARCEGSPQT